MLIGTETSPDSGSAPLREWHMQYNKNSLTTSGWLEGEDGWITLYTFSEAEVFQRDIDTANYIVYTYDSMPFRDSMLCCKRLPLTLEDLTRAGYVDDNEDDRQVLQVVSARPDIRWVRSWSLEGRKAVNRVGGKVIEEVHLGSEIERLRFLRDTVGLGLDEDDVKWIAGRAASF